MDFGTIIFWLGFGQSDVELEVREILFDSAEVFHVKEFA